MVASRRGGCSCVLLSSVKCNQIWVGKAERLLYEGKPKRCKQADVWLYGIVEHTRQLLQAHPQGLN